MPAIKLQTDIHNNMVADDHVATSARRVDTEQGHALINTVRDRQTRALWCELNPWAPVCFEPRLLEELRRIQASTASGNSHEGQYATRFQVLCSSIPRVFSYGGDLQLIASLVRQRDWERLREYAHLATDIVYSAATSAFSGITTIAVVEGAAFGGGFEAALSADVIVAERGAEFGFPEIRFNMFPGMGALQLLLRRTSSFKAREMILSGRIYKAEELYGWGIIEVLAERGEARQSAADYIRRTSCQLRGRDAFSVVLATCNPISKEELYRTVEIWLEAARNLQEKDIRIMEFLARSQKTKPGALVVNERNASSA
jgi:DSF synthase